jgi:hypothetical protein
MTKLVKWDAAGVEAWASVAGEGAVLMQSLRGFVDAGRAGSLVADHVLSLTDAIRVATFDIDQLLDYRSRRPQMTFTINQWTDYDEPQLVLDLVRDAKDRPFLLLHGVEPDILWERYILAVKEIVRRMGIGLTVGAHGIPMAAPHTRPLTTTVHGTRQELLPNSASFLGTVTVPASAQNLLEYRFGQWGIDVVNVVVHVPYYLAQSALPQAAQRALTEVESLTGLDFDIPQLDAAASVALDEIDRQLRESEDVVALVSTLEEQYDQFVAARERGLPLEGPLPSADEIGAEFEKFLEQQRRDLPPHA